MTNKKIKAINNRILANKSRLKKINERLAKIKERQAKIKERQSELIQAYVEEKTAAGWQKFHFFSDYYGSHPEWDGDIECTFLFHPSVDLSRWDGVEFSHGSRGQSQAKDEWDDWLDEMDEDLYIEVD